MEDITEDAIAIIGISGRFPGARNISEYWQNLVAGTESVTFFGEDELRAAGTPEEDLADPNYVPAAPVIDQPEWLDAALFGLSRREAEVIDPQHRVFMETTYSAFMHAGYDPYCYGGRVGVFAGARDNEYLTGNVVKNASILRAVGRMVAALGNHTDYLSTRVAFQFGLRGPALSVVTACSTSLVAVHLAVRALREHECEMAVAGGVEICLPATAGYFYTEGGMLSPDGHVRSFDARARGTVFGSGCGAVLLKPLRDALADNDTIHAVIRGSAINNDGSAKSAFSAPSQVGQVEVVTAALRDAAVSADSLGYIEAHGTGTFVGDPIEFKALSQALRAGTDRRNYCVLQSVKANIGHLGAAAGIAGLIKAVHCVQKGVLPPVINFETPNPQIDLADSPFVISPELTPWPTEEGRRRAGISSFGVGGTNAHVIIEQAPDRAPCAAPSRPYELLVLSARTPAALEMSAAALAEHLGTGSTSLHDAASTLANSRAGHASRNAVVARDCRDAAARLRELRPAQAATRHSRPVAFLFPGQASQYPGMARDLYQMEPVFASWIDRCADVLGESHGLDLRAAMFADPDSPAAADRLNQTCVAQPAIFAVEYSLAMLLREHGVRPASMIGHSIGEYVAAALADVFTLEDGLRLVADRGALMQALPRGSMMAVLLPEAQLTPMLTDGVGLAAVNAPGLCVVSGTCDDIAELQQLLTVQGIVCRPLHASHAFHSAMMDPILDEFHARVSAVALNAPQIRYVSNLTGTWITKDEATDPGYWVRHLRGCVRFSEAVQLLQEDGGHVLYEVGPGRTLSGAGGKASGGIAMVPAMCHPQQDRNDVEVLLESIGEIWAQGGEVEFGRLAARQHCRRVPLPDYPYERQRFWVEPDEDSEPAAANAADRSPFSVPAWHETARPQLGTADTGSPWLVFAPETSKPRDPVSALIRRLRDAGVTVVTATPAAGYERLADRAGIRPDAPDDYQRLLDDVTEPGQQRLRVIHAWSVGTSPDSLDELGAASRWLNLGFFSALTVMQASAGLMARGTAVDICIVSSDMQDVIGDGAIEPAKSAVIGLVKTGPKEFENLSCRSIDISLRDGSADREVTDALIAELTTDRTAITQDDSQIAYRGRKRWTWRHDGITLTPATGVPAALRPGGVYLITGGLGGLGLALARHLTERVGAKLVLLGRTRLPDRGQWSKLATDVAEDAVAKRIRAVEQLEALGAEVLVCAGDVTDEKQMRTVRAAAEKRFGRVDGIFHLAGVAGGGMLESRPREAAEKVFAPKVDGCYVLDEVFGGSTDLMVLFSSITAITAEFGLGDYSAANAVMDAFAQRRWAAGRRVFSINWPTWAEVGMAAEIEQPRVMQAVRYAEQPADVRHPMLTGRFGEAGQPVAFFVDATTRQWVLAEHQMIGRPSMPAAGIVELMRAGFEELTGNPRAEITDLIFPKLLKANEDEEVQLRVTPVEDGGFHLALHGITMGRGPVEYARCRVKPAAPADPPRHDLAALRSQCTADAATSLRPMVSLSTGPRWNNLNARSVGPGLELLALELADQYAADLDAYYLHPALLDRATALVYHLEPAFSDGTPPPPQGGAEADAEWHHDVIPFGYDRVVVRGPLPARCQAIVRRRPGGSSDVIQYDIALTGPDGVELAAIEGFTMIRVPDAPPDTAAGDDAAVPAAEPDRVRPDVSIMLDPDQAEAGIRPSEAGEVLDRILARADLPQVIWSPIGLGENMRRAARLTRANLAESSTWTAVGAPSARDFDTPYVEPANDTERALARLWQDALGIDQVGAEDDFFDLAGNSLVAVQLVARVGQQFGVNVTVAQLFECRTVRRFATAINEANLARVSSMTDDEAREALRKLEAAS